MNRDEFLLGIHKLFDSHKDKSGTISGWTSKDSTTFYCRGTCTHVDFFFDTLGPYDVLIDHIKDKTVMLLVDFPDFCVVKC